MFEKIIESSTETVKKTIEKGTEPIWDRLKNPFIASFTISWILWNWKAIIFFIFSKQLVEYKLLYISKTFYDWGIGWDYGWIPVIVNCLIIPSIYAYIYIRFLPDLENYFDKKTKPAFDIKNNKILTDEQKKIERLGTLEEDIAKKEERIFAIKNKLAEGETVATLKDRINSLSDQLSESNALNEKVTRESTERITNMRETYDLQISEMNTSIESQSKKIVELTKERESLRVNLTASEKNVSDLQFFLNESEAEKDKNIGFMLSLISSILNKSRFLDPTFPNQVFEEMSKYEGDSKILGRLRSLVQDHAKFYDLTYYEINVEHGPRENIEVRTTLNSLAELFGRNGYFKNNDNLSTFQFHGDKELNEEEFGRIVRELPGVTNASLSKYSGPSPGVIID